MEGVASGEANQKKRLASLSVNQAYDAGENRAGVPWLYTRPPTGCRGERGCREEFQNKPMRLKIKIPSMK